MALYTYIEVAEKLLDHTNAIGTTAVAVVGQDHKLRMAQILKSLSDDGPTEDEKHLDSVAWWWADTNQVRQKHTKRRGK